MNAPSSVHALTSALVHQSALASPLTRSHHADFIAKRLFIAFLVLGIAPVYISIHGAPSALETLVFAFSFTPLAAALVLTRTGRVGLAHGVACLGLVGLSICLYRIGCGAGVFAIWLFAALLEAICSGNRRLVWVAATLALAGIAAAAGTSAVRMEPAAMAPTAATLLAGLALVYALIITPMPTTAEVPAAGAQPDAGEWEQTLSGLVDDVVIGLDSSGSVTTIRTNETHRLSVAAAELMGRGLFEHVHVADRPSFLKLVADAARGEAPATARLRLRVVADPSEPASPPQHIWIEMRATRLVTRANDRRDTSAVVAVLRNVEPARAPEAEDVGARTITSGTIRSEDAFLASMSHELRTPLNAIIGFSEMLASYTMRPTELAKQREYARIIHQAGLHLLSVVNEILDMSKTCSGTVHAAEIECLARNPNVQPDIGRTDRRMKKIA